MTASGGIPPYTFTLSSGALPNGLTLAPNGALTGTPSASGVFSPGVTVTDSSPSPVAGARSHDKTPQRGFTRAVELKPRAATGTANFGLTVRSPSTDLLLSAGSLSFSLPVGSVALPPAQAVGVVSTGATQINYTGSVSAGAGWLSVTSSGTTPGSIAIGLTNQAAALPPAAGPYQASVLVTCLNPAPCAGNSQTVAVSLTVTSTPAQLTVPTNLISFATPASSPQVQSQGLLVQNTGGGTIGFGSAACESAWCTVTGVPGSIGAGASASLTVTADPSRLAAGFYRTAVDLKTSAGLASVPVTLFIATNSSMTLQPAGTLFQSVRGGVPNGGVNSFLVGVVGSNPVSWSAAVLPGAGWLSVTTPSGTAAATQPGVVSFSIDSSATGALAPQAYYGTIRVTSTSVVNSPLDFQVVLNVAPSGAAQAPSPSPAGLLFLSAAGTQPPAQTVQLTTNSPSSVGYSASASGGSWLSVSPGSGTVAPGSGTQLQVSVNPSNLNAGTYTGGVTFSFNGSAEVRTVNVTLIVPLASQAVQSDRPGEVSLTATPVCTPTQIVPVPIGMLNNFSVPAGFPQTFSAQLMNNCGVVAPGGQIVATFSNGDPALPLTSVNPATGVFGATWVPRQAAGQVTITATASAPGFAPTSIQLSGAVTPNGAPLLAPNGAVNIYNPVAGAALAPGTLVQISGSALAAASSTSPAPLPTTLGNTQVTIGGRAAPLMSVSPSVLTAQVPFELAPLMQYQVVVNNNGAVGSPASIQLAATDPGLATSTSGLVSAAHLNGTPVTASAPAAPAEYIVLTAIGLGLTDSVVPDGAASPASPPANVVDMPTVTIGGQQALVSWAGLQPGAVGVYQINVKVPLTAPDGNLTLVLLQDGNPANTGILPVLNGQ
jgi:uncharacterized protein (TIGR03437 family)